MLRHCQRNGRSIGHGWFPHAKSRARPTTDGDVYKRQTWDGRDKRVTYMECFGRLMAGLAPWLSLPDDDTAEGKQRRQLRECAVKSYAQAVDPESQDYLLWRKEGQPLVDAAYVAESFLLSLIHILRVL